MLIGFQQWWHTGRSSYLCQKEQIQIGITRKILTEKQQPEKHVNIIINRIFQQCLKDES
jgi:hypothetical protein